MSAMSTIDVAPEKYARKEQGFSAEEAERRLAALEALCDGTYRARARTLSIDARCSRTLFLLWRQRNSGEGPKFYRGD
jgi:hypothetical protein